MTPFDLKDTHSAVIIRVLGSPDLPWVCACAYVPDLTHNPESRPAAQGVFVVHRALCETQQLRPLLNLVSVRSDSGHSCAAGDEWVQSGFSLGGEDKAGRRYGGLAHIEVGSMTPPGEEPLGLASYCPCYWLGWAGSRFSALLLACNPLP